MPESGDSAGQLTPARRSLRTSAERRPAFTRPAEHRWRERGYPGIPGRIYPPLEVSLFVDQAASILGLSRGTVLRRLHRGQLAGLRFGHFWVLHREDVEEHAAERMANGAGTVEARP